MMPSITDRQRRRTEQLQQSLHADDSASGPDVDKLARELELLQVELALQGELMTEAFDEAALAREKYDSLFALAPIGFFTMSGDAKILEINDRGAELLGLAREHALGRNLGDFVADDSVADFAFLMSRLWGTLEHASAHSLLVMREPPHLPIFVDARARGILDKESGEVRVQMVWVDVSLEKAARDDAIRALANADPGRLN